MTDPFASQRQMLQNILDVYAKHHEFFQGMSIYNQDQIFWLRRVRGPKTLDVRLGGFDEAFHHLAELVGPYMLPIELKPMPKFDFDENEMRRWMREFFKNNAIPF